MSGETSHGSPTSPATADEQLRRTPLVDRHLALGARLIPFAGWLMPVQYSGIINEHRAVRERAGLFDLGHMGQVSIDGTDAESFLQEVTTNDVSALGPGDAQYSLLPNPTGGVIDDIIVYRQPSGDGYFVVLNASNAERDIAWLEEQAAARPGHSVEVRDVSDATGMIAIQGPLAERIVRGLTDRDLSAVTPFTWSNATVAGVPLRIARTGYTGEDGFEFYVAIDQVGRLWDELMHAGAAIGLVPVGLGARDTLRLEARMPLYGNELSDTINPLEAGLGWAVKLDKGPFIGRAAMAAMKADGAPRRTVGFKLTERAGAPRTGYAIEVGGRAVGQVTSGAFSPTLGENIGLGLIERESAGVGKPLEIVIRGKPVPAVQVKLPFYRRSTLASESTS